MLFSRDILMNSLLNRLMAFVSFREPSGETQVTSRSINSTQPPGLAYLESMSQGEIYESRIYILEALPV